MGSRADCGWVCDASGAVIRFMKEATIRFANRSGPRYGQNIDGSADVDRISPDPGRIRY